MCSKRDNKNQLLCTIYYDAVKLPKTQRKVCDLERKREKKVFDNFLFQRSVHKPPNVKSPKPEIFKNAKQTSPNKTSIKLSKGHSQKPTRRHCTDLLRIPSHIYFVSFVTPKKVNERNLIENFIGILKILFETISSKPRFSTISLLEE